MCVWHKYMQTYRQTDDIYTTMLTYGTRITDIQNTDQVEKLLALELVSYFGVISDRVTVTAVAMAEGRYVCVHSVCVYLREQVCVFARSTKLCVYLCLRDHGSSSATLWCHHCTSIVWFHQ